MFRRPAFLLLLATACAAPPPADVLVDAKLAARWIHGYDEARREATFKVFHEIRHPGDPALVLTKGPGGEYPHHRGVFLGWNRTTRGDARFDFWHCNHGESQRHVAFVGDGAAGAPQAMAVDWLGADGAVIVHEVRALAVRDRADGARQCDFTMELRAAVGTVQLRGDPHHAGFHFRAANAWALPDTPKVTFLRPAGALDRGNDIWGNCGWVAARLPLAPPVTVVLVDHPGNPRGSRWSTRDYGRFGVMPQADLGADPLRLRYRLLLVQGEVDADRCAAWAREFAGGNGPAGR